MKKLILLSLLLISSVAYAGSYHQNDQTHVITYVILDNNGDFVPGQTVRATLYRPYDNKYFDWSDRTFKDLSSVSSLHSTMNTNSTNSTYFLTISVDNGILISGDIVVTVSNDDATYNDHQSDTVSFDKLEKVVKINR